MTSTAACPDPIRHLLTAYFCPNGSTWERGNAVQVSDAALEALEAGFDSPILCAMAGLSGPLNDFEMESLLRRMMEELALPMPSIDELRPAAPPARTVEEQGTHVDAPQPVTRSLYLLEFSNPRGGATLGQVHAYSHLEHLEQVLRQLFLGAPGMVGITATYAVEVGANLWAWVVSSGALTHWVDLRRFINVHVRAGASFRLDDDEARHRLLTNGGDPVDEDVTFRIDWKQLRRAIPGLCGKRARPGELLLVDHERATVDVPEDSVLYSGTFGLLELAYGWNDLEDGGPAPDDFVDPDPPA